MALLIDDMEKTVLERKESRIARGIAELRDAMPIRKEEKKQKLLSAIGAMTVDEGGLRYLLEHISEIEQAGVFENTVWAQPEKLTPSLVGGTLQSGFPLDVMETLSELRMLALSMDKHKTEAERDMASAFLREVIVKNLNLLFPDSDEASRNKHLPASGRKAETLFSFLIAGISSDAIKASLAEEVQVLAAQRRIVTDRLERMLQLVEERIPLDGDTKADQILRGFLAAARHPSPGATAHRELEAYLRFLEGASTQQLRAEATHHGNSIVATGLVAPSHVVLIKHLSKHRPELVPTCLALEGHGLVEWQKHEAFILSLIERGITLDFKQSVYGLHRLLKRSLLSRTPVENALIRLLNLILHAEVDKLLRIKRPHLHDDTRTLLIAGVICVLGLPLGIGQGNNPTCQSARGISMWSQHSPAKLLQMIILCARVNSLDITYEGEFFESKMVTRGLTESFDFNLDPVSIVLVPHLDKLYNAMMEKAALKYPHLDPHTSVNPEFYGSFIQNGFIAAYDPVFHAIKDYERFVRIFYHSYHPEFNGGNPVVYPVPLGIFITTAQAEMLGFHAISLLRIDKDPTGAWRAYFLNPNDEGRQNWGQDISPSVHGQGEKPGESSLPFAQLVSRVYAFHYNELAIKQKNLELPEGLVARVEKLARESWGRKYNWM